MDYNFTDNKDIIASLDSYNNPTIHSPNCHYVIQFYETKQSLLDIDEYKAFLDNAIARFRHSIAYTNYKGFLYGLGLDRCAFNSNINKDMAELEMHHNMLNIFDISLIISEHILNTVGYITTFDVVQCLKEEHRNNRIQLVMLTKTPHQLYHHNRDFYIHPDMCFGNWIEFLERYNKGITLEIAYKILFYIKRALKDGVSNDAGLLNIREQILNWSGLNGNVSISELGL
jgi:hypothetical protein